MSEADIAKLPAALRRVPREATQPGSLEMLSYDQVMDLLGKLSMNPRVRVELLGSSRAGRAIPLVAITNAADARRLDQIAADAARLTAPQLRHEQVTDPVVVVPQLGEPPPGFRLPILFQSSNFGMEASQVEALIQLAEFFATDQSEATTRALDRLVILIVPLINPDGREIALAHWAARPLSPAWSAQGNLCGVEVTREFLHQTDPESRALAHLVNRWHPFVVWEVHEDGIGLGWGHPNTCLCPPIGPPDGIGIDSPVAASINDPRIYAEFQRYGKAIAQAWADRGYDYLYEPEGRHGWPRYPVAGFSDLAPAPETRFTQSMQLRGVPAFITESCRIPGSQTWEDRIGQKVSAGIAVAGAAAAAPEPLVQLVSSVHRDAWTGAGSESFFLLPLDQERYALCRAVEILSGHEISVYRTHDPMAEPALVVPASQPLRQTLQLLLASDQGRHQSLGPAIGLRVLPCSSLTDSERTAWEAAALEPVTSPADLWSAQPGPFAAGYWYEVANSHHGVTLVSRLLQVPDADVWWDTSPAQRAGRFLFRASEQPDDIVHAARSLHVAITQSSEPADGLAVRLRQPRIGLYEGQGQLENRYNGSLLRWFLADWDLPFTPVGPKEIRADVLDDLDVLIVQAGDAASILTGRGPDTVWHRYPWELDEDPVIVSSEQVAVLRQWVHSGGTYIGIDAGGGLLASRDFLGLVDADREQWNMGVGLVELTVDRPDELIFNGMRGSWGPDGAWRDGVIYAMYSSHPRGGLNGGCVFSADGASVLASFDRTLRVNDIPHIQATSNFRQANGGAAIVGSAVGEGYAAILGIEPTYRATFVRSARLISNLIYSSVTRLNTA